MIVLQMKPVCVPTRINKALKGYGFRSDEDFNVMVGAMVPAVAQGFFMHWCMGLWDLHLVSSVTLSRTIPKLVSFEQLLYMYR